MIIEELQKELQELILKELEDKTQAKVGEILGVKQSRVSEYKDGNLPKKYETLEKHINKLKEYGHN